MQDCHKADNRTGTGRGFRGVIALPAQGTSHTVAHAYCSLFVSLFCYILHVFHMMRCNRHCSGKPELAGCPLDYFLTRGFGAKYYGSDALTGANHQKHTGLQLFCIH